MIGASQSAVLLLRLTWTSGAKEPMTESEKTQTPRRRSRRRRRGSGNSTTTGQSGAMAPSSSAPASEQTAAPSATERTSGNGVSSQEDRGTQAKPPVPVAGDTGRGGQENRQTNESTGGREPGRGRGRRRRSRSSSAKSSTPQAESAGTEAGTSAPREQKDARGRVLRRPHGATITGLRFPDRGSATGGPRGPPLPSRQVHRPRMPRRRARARC